EILKKFNFAIVKTASTPIETNKALVKDEEAEAIDVHLYRSMIGSLMYLTAFRPNIMFVVCACARFQVTPKTSRIHAVKRNFRYLKGQPKLGLWYPRDSSFNLEAFSDSDYVGASLDMKSTTGALDYLISEVFFKGRLILDERECNNKQKWVKGHDNPLIPNTHSQLKAKRTTEISQSSRPIHLVVDETIYKEWEDRMKMAATIASSLVAEQDSGNINRTQSMATLNESFPQGTGLGSGPRC
ncbi:hypothetical protein Tco_1372931, partial [Tanacetum coccineum]